MISIPFDCPRKRTDCRSLSNIIADDNSTFFCCGENNGESRSVEQDKYTVCFKGEYRDAIDHYDKRDLIHHSSVMMQALAAVEKCHDPEAQQDCDWSAWKDL
jgi:hypothetical protein